LVKFTPVHQLLRIIFGWIATAGTAWCLGKLFLRRLSVGLYRQEENVFAFVLGSACLSMLLVVLAAGQMLYRGVFLALSVVIVGLAVQRRVYRPGGPPLPPMPRQWQFLFWAVYLPFAGLYLMQALAPEASPDGSSYHLGLVRRYLHDGGFSRITNDFHASLPQGMEMLFLFAFAWGRHSAAALVHCTFLLTLPFVVLVYARRVGMPAVGVVGGLLMFTSPIAGIAGTSAYNDVAIACVLFTLFAFLQIWNEARSTGLLVPASVLAGFAFALKYTAFLAIPYTLGFVTYQLIRSRKALMRPVLIAFLCCSVMVLPTLIKNWWVVGNPVSPFFNRTFPNPYIHVSFEDALKIMMRNYGQIQSVWEVPFEITVKGGSVAGLLGPVFLLAPLCLFALRNRTGRQLLLAALIFALPYPTNIGTRFLLPSVVFLAPALALAVMGWRGAAVALLLAHAVSTWPGVVDRYCTSYAWRIIPVSGSVVLRREPQDRYLKTRLDGYETVLLINSKVPAGARVFSLSAMPDAYCNCEVLVSYYSAENERLRDTLFTALLPTEREGRKGVIFRLNPRSVRRIRLVQTAGGKEDMPGIFELRVLTSGGEIPYSNTWRVSAHPFPWDAQLAFDGNAVTRWRAWQPEFPGMFVEADFGKEQEIAGVRLETSLIDQWGVQWELHGQRQGGPWEVLARAPEQVASQEPANLRALAIQQLRSAGIEYLLVDSSDYSARDFKDKTRLWGIEIAGAIPRATLYRLR
jgi:hypothetical protein